MMTWKKKGKHLLWKKKGKKKGKKFDFEKKRKQISFEKKKKEKKIATFLHCVFFIEISSSMNLETEISWKNSGCKKKCKNLKKTMSQFLSKSKCAFSMQFSFDDYLWCVFPNELLEIVKLLHVTFGYNLIAQPANIHHT